MTANMDTIEIKTFLPAQDFDLSKRFYLDLGFTMAWGSDEMAYLHAGRSSFLLTRFYEKPFAENLMMSLLVVDVEAWWQHVVAQDLGARYGVRVNPPEDRPWGMRDFTIDDPSGVLWRIGQSIDQPA
jgi:catechol 2,3-dioxygenase-like lactoylglutathione lyase family enzyme